jgi:hypothetical protein
MLQGDIPGSKAHDMHVAMVWFVASRVRGFFHQPVKHAVFTIGIGMEGQLTAPNTPLLVQRVT